MATLRELIQQYVEIRHKKSVLKKKHEEELAPYNVALDQLESYFLAAMDKQGVDSISAHEAGTIYRSKRTSATVVDFDAVLAFCAEHDAWHLLKAQVNPAQVETYIEETGEVPPGLNINRIQGINVRKK